MTKKWKQKWNALIHHRFFRSKACERWLIGLVLFGMTIGFVGLGFAEYGENKEWMALLFFVPGFIAMFLYWHYRPIDVGRILRTFKIKKNVEVTDNGKIII